MTKEIVIVSACLIGVKCRYDGRDALDKALLDFLKGKEAVPVCPEELGSLPTPRPRAEMTGTGEEVLSGAAKVLDENGKDVTTAFIEGARKTLEIARAHNGAAAFLKEGSPSCGVMFIKRKGLRIEGPGVTAALLKKEGIKTEGRG